MIVLRTTCSNICFIDRRLFPCLFISSISTLTNWIIRILINFLHICDQYIKVHHNIEKRKLKILNTVSILTN